jgi:hypothetical protein
MNKISIITLILYIVSIVYTVVTTIYPDALPRAITDRALLLISNSIIFILATQFYIHYLQFEEFRSKNEKILEKSTKYYEVLNSIFEDFYKDFEIFCSKNETFMEKDALYSSLVSSFNLADNIFSDVVRKQYKIFSSRVKDAANGKLILDPGDVLEIPILLAQQLATSLDATSWWGVNDPLEDTQKMEYLQEIESKVATASPCNVRRLFILRKGDDSMQEFQSRFQNDKNKGIKVRYIFEEDWVVNFKVKHPVDFGIWDRKRLWMFEKNLSTNKYESHFVIDADTLGYFQEAFNLNWSKGIL